MAAVTVQPTPISQGIKAPVPKVEVVPLAIEEDSTDAASFQDGQTLVEIVAETARAASKSPIQQPKPSLQAFDTLQTGHSLIVDEALVSANHQYRLIYQPDGNCVLYHGSSPVGASNTKHANPSKMELRADGSLVLVSQEGKVAHTLRKPSTFKLKPAGSLKLQLQNSGKLVLTDTAGTVWWSPNLSVSESEQAALYREYWPEYDLF